MALGVTKADVIRYDLELHLAASMVMIRESFTLPESDCQQMWKTMEIEVFPKGRKLNEQLKKELEREKGRRL